MRIVCISDTHTYGPRLELPPGDVLVHAGDHTFRGTEAEMRPAFQWLDGLDYEHKVIIGGNHDFYLDSNSPEIFRGWRIKRPENLQAFLEGYPTLTYLHDSAVEIQGIKFYGSPYQPWYGGWAFNFPRMQPAAYLEAQNTWDKIPDDVHVLITHGPVHGILDSAQDESKVGCPVLGKRISELTQLRLHICGHIHESYGRVDCETESKRPITFVNASMCNLAYDPDNLRKPIVVDI